MNIFLKKTFFFILPVIIIVVLTEMYARMLPSNYKEKENGLIKEADKIELLILGNSHATYSISPEEFDMYAFNAAQVGQSLYFDKRITLKHIDKLKKIKYVFITLDFHSFYFSSQFQRNYWSYYANGIEYKDELLFYEKNLHMLGYSPKVLLKQIKTDYSNDGRVIKSVDVENGVDLNHPIAKGFFSFTGTNQKVMNEKNYQLRANYFNNMVMKSTEKTEVIKDFEQFIGLLKGKGIHPVLLTTPCYEPYRKMLNQFELNQNTLEITKIAEKFNIEYWDYFGFDIDQSCFYNCDHLNSKGANIFSKILNLRIKEYAKTIDNKKQ